MTNGFDYSSAEAVEVATEAIREQARSWNGLSDRMEEVRRNVAGLHLSMSAFMVADPAVSPAAAADLANAYHRMHRSLMTLCKGATTEFEKFATALGKAADWYEDADRNTVVSMSKIYGKAD